jgi:hypothetical protein
LRLDAYLAEVKAISAGDPKDLKERTALAARSLGIRVDQQCFDKPTEQQAPCLIQHTDGLVLDDAGVQTRLTQLTNGSAADMMNQLSYSALGGAGQFSPYVGAVVDLARILSTLHTAKYQYIPALALPQRAQQDTLNLRLNVPPSFRDPKSVIVVALPPILQKGSENADQPALHPVDPAQNYCAQKPSLALLADGAPLVFATPLAHDLVLHLDTKAKPPQQAAPQSLLELNPTPAPAAQSGVDIPLKPDSVQGGFVLEKPVPALPENEVTGEIRGKWGFDNWNGPKFHLRSPHAGGWTVLASDQNALITGREDTLRIQGENTLCVADVRAEMPAAAKSEVKTESKVEAKSESEPSDHSAHPEKFVKLTWKSPKPDLLDVSVPLKDGGPGTVTIAIDQYGLATPEKLPLKAYAEAAALDHLTLSAGDKVAVLKGKRLDEVDSADLAGITFAPSALNRVQDFDQLEMTATGLTATLQPGANYTAKVTLRDGRHLQAPATVEPPRPQVDLLSKGVQHDEAETASGTPPPVHLGSPNDLPLQRRLVFFLRSRVPATFARTEKIEIASSDAGGDSFKTTLSFADGSLMLEDAHTAVAVIDPLARFGPSAFGPVQLRAVTADGTTGDWVPLGTLVRLPGFSPASALHCPRNAAKPCSLTGNNLFLITAIGTAPDMASAQDVPAEFTGDTLTVPNVARPGSSGASGTLYFSLRDDPDTVQTLTLPVAPPPTAAGPAAGPATPTAPDSGSTPTAKAEGSTPPAQ